jgi:hypothetical protein
MTRVNPQTSVQPDHDWQDDTWYPVQLKSYEVQPKGRDITYQGKTKPHPYVTLDITWVLLPDLDADVWVRDFVDVRLRADREGKPPKAKLLICCLAGRDPRQESTPWIDEDSLEYGFGAAEADPPAGRIVTGLQLQVKGVAKESERGTFLRVERYAALAGVPVAVPAATVPAGARQRSEDGRWEWDGTAWVPLGQPAAEPAAGTQTSLI